MKCECTFITKMKEKRFNRKLQYFFHVILDWDCFNYKVYVEFNPDDTKIWRFFANETRDT